MPAVTSALRPDATALTRRLLACGALAGPLFVAVVLVQDHLRPGVRPREQPLSLLTLGDLGWVQVGAFLGAGLGNLAFAVGVRRALHPGPAGVAGPLLIGGHGLGLVAAGVFVPDPAFGFPPGAPPGLPVDPSWHDDLHSVAAVVAFGCLVSATVVFGSRFARRGARAEAFGSAAVGAAVLGLVVVGADPDRAAVALRAAVLLGWLWASWLALRLGAEGRSRNGRDGMRARGSGSPPPR